jgi:hypothetical protein
VFEVDIVGVIVVVANELTLPNAKAINTITTKLTNNFSFFIIIFISLYLNLTSVIIIA